MIEYFAYNPFRLKTLAGATVQSLDSNRPQKGGVGVPDISEPLVTQALGGVA
jgi:hypothetical protein